MTSFVAETAKGEKFEFKSFSDAVSWTCVKGGPCTIRPKKGDFNPFPSRPKKGGKE